MSITEHVGDDLQNRHGEVVLEHHVVVTGQMLLLPLLLLLLMQGVWGCCERLYLIPQLPLLPVMWLLLM